MKLLKINSDSPNLRAVVGDVTEGTIRCLENKVDVVEFQDFVCAS